MRSSTSLLNSSTLFSSAAAPAIPTSTLSVVNHSSWHLTVSYLFGGLAAMLGFIALALFALACSYWKLSGYLETNAMHGRNDSRGDAFNLPVRRAKLVMRELAIPVICDEKKIVVIMAGDEKPTFIATSKSSGATSFDSTDRSVNGDKDDSQ